MRLRWTLTQRTRQGPPPKSGSPAATRPSDGRLCSHSPVSGVPTMQRGAAEHLSSWTSLMPRWRPWRHMWRHTIRATFGVFSGAQIYSSGIEGV